jgi:hypothetical protein
VIGLIRQIDSNDAEGINNGLHGLTLASTVCLSDYIQAVVDSPETLGIKPDPDYYDYTHFTKGRGKSIVKGSTRSEHLISEVAAKANSLIFKLNGVNNWKYLERFRGEIDSTIDVLQNILTTFYIVKDSEGNEISPSESIKFDSLSLMLVSFTDIRPLFHRYTDYYHDDPKNLPEYDEVFGDFQDQHTRFDGLFLTSSFVAKQPPIGWARGYALTIHETIKSLTNNRETLIKLSLLDSVVMGLKDWNEFEKYDHELFDIFGIQNPYSNRYSLKSAPPAELLEKIKGEPRPIKSPERLLSIIGNRARIVDSCSSSGCVLNFSCVLDGVVARSKKTGVKARIIIFIHGLNQDRENYSIGIFMPAYGSGLIETNGSVWWIFYYIGNNHSGTASKQMAEVQELLKQNEQHIEMKYIEADEAEFLAYCEDPGYRRLDIEKKCIDQMVAKLRGTYPELLIANYLTNRSYYPVKIRIVPSCINGVQEINGDLDVVGFKVEGDSCQITIFESKGQARTDRDLDEELAKFSRTVKWLNGHIEEFRNQYTPDFRGECIIDPIFVSLGDLHLSRCEIINNLHQIPFLSRYHSPKVPKNIKLWDLPRLLKELKEVGTPDIYWELIQEMPVAISI